MPSAFHTRRSPRRPEWATRPDDELLDMRFCDLKLDLRDSAAAPRVSRLYAELAHQGIKFRPHCWLAEEWFSPDGVPGIAIPFYLAHPRLAKLEQQMMHDVEGGDERGCMRLLRHEAGHAIDTAYRLHRRKLWHETFGNPRKPYPAHYTPKPQSKNYVLHLDWWYAQSHPAEDFAETFAIWLQPGNGWRKKYAGWPARKKIDRLDEMIESIRGLAPRNATRRQVEPLRTNKRTLRQHYESKRVHYGINVPQVYDSELQRLFTADPKKSGSRRTAAALLRRYARELCRSCAKGTGEHPYVIAQIIQDMIVRCRELKLYICAPDETVKTEIAVFITVHTLNYLHKVKHRVPV
ncbi:MAG: hypothetical protein HKO62_09115 [Gammaproteobacteria bacterium]|nr:hypothetical protein [Gammaproteobacteria bacterium]